MNRKYIPPTNLAGETFSLINQFSRDVNKNQLADHDRGNWSLEIQQTEMH